MFIFAALLLIAGVIFMVQDGPSKVRRIYHNNQAKTAYSKEFGALASPLRRLGFENTVSPKPTCIYTPIYSYEGDQLLCQAASQQYTVIGSEPAAKAEYVAKAKELDSLLAENKWATFSNTAKSFEEWMTAVSSGVDYNTDITSNLSRNGSQCTISMTVAYSNPAPPAVNTVLTCNAPEYKVLHGAVGSDSD